MINKLIVILAIFFLSLPFFVSADSPYFEFNPAYYNTDSLAVADSETPSEVFIPQNDFMNGFDLWLDNDGTGGPTTFELSASGNPDDTLVSKTVTIPRIAKIAGGQRFHIGFNQLAVFNDQTYAIKVISDLPALELFYANRINLLPQNAPYLSEYANGIAFLGSEKQNFSFKFALYEGAESAKPILTNIAAAPVTETQFKISFNANEPVDYKLMYRLAGAADTNQTEYLNDYNFCSDALTPCTQFINVEPASKYDYILSVKDRWGNTTQAVGSFVTLGSSDIVPTGSDDTTPPIISNIRLFPDAGNTVDIAWTTDEAANSTYLISYSEYMISIDAGNDTTYELEHFMRTNPLNPDTNYIATITSRDLNDNPISVSFVFNTGNLTGTITPTPIFTATPYPSPTGSGSPATSTPTTTPTTGPTSTPWPTISFQPTITPATTPTSSSQPSGQPSPSQTGSLTPSQTTSPTGSGSPATPSTSSGQAGTPATTPTPSSQSDSLPTLTVTSDANNSTTIGWTAPSSGEPGSGYRIDILDEHGKKITSQEVPSGSHQANVGILNANDTVIVYANNDQTFQKIAKAEKIQPLTIKKSFLETLVTFLPYILGVIILLIFGIVIFMKYFKKQKPPTTPDGPSTDSYSSAQSVRN